jgi:hypothetical protein
MEGMTMKLSSTQFYYEILTHLEESSEAGELTDFLKAILEIAKTHLPNALTAVLHRIGTLQDGLILMELCEVTKEYDPKDWPNQFKRHVLKQVTNQGIVSFGIKGIPHENAANL